jgi:hypothetical protein
MLDSVFCCLCCSDLSIYLSVCLPVCLPVCLLATDVPKSPYAHTPLFFFCFFCLFYFLYLFYLFFHLFIFYFLYFFVFFLFGLRADEKDIDGAAGEGSFPSPLPPPIILKREGHHTYTYIHIHARHTSRNDGTETVIDFWAKGKTA